MLLVPFGFTTSTFVSSGPTNLVPPSISLIGNNQLQYTPGVWSPGVYPPDVWNPGISGVYYEWYVNGVALEDYSETITVPLGASVYIEEYAFDEYEDAWQVSNTFVMPDMFTPPVVYQPSIRTILYDIGNWTEEVSSQMGKWVINGVETEIEAILGAEIDGHSIGAVSGDIISVNEYVNDVTIFGKSNDVIFLPTTDSASIEWNITGSYV